MWWVSWFWLWDRHRFPPNFLVKFRWKNPLPLPLTGGTPCLELKQAPSGPTTKKNLGAPGPPMGEIWGVKFSTSPPSPSISPNQILEFFRPRAGLVPCYNPWDFGKFAYNAAGDIFDFILAPGPMVCIVAKTYKTESFILLDTPPHHTWAVHHTQVTLLSKQPMTFA